MFSTTTNFIGCSRCRPMCFDSFISRRKPSIWLGDIVQCLSHSLPSHGLLRKPADHVSCSAAPSTPGSWFEASVYPTPWRRGLEAFNFLRSIRSADESSNGVHGSKCYHVSAAVEQLLRGSASGEVQIALNMLKVCTCHILCSDIKQPRTWY